MIRFRDVFEIAVGLSIGICAAGFLGLGTNREIAWQLVSVWIMAVIVYWRSEK